jgi:hypothetical protein
MPKLIIMVLDDVDALPAVLEAWHRQGASGVTVLESSGMARLSVQHGRDDFPLFPGLRNFLVGREVHHRTLFTVLDDDIDVNGFFAATEAVVGALDSPGTGIIMALPVLAVRGMKRDGGLVGS